MLVSKRGNALITQDSKGKRMLTVEDYMKWYEFYMIDEENKVTEVEWNEHFDEGWRDHCIVPESFHNMAKMLGADYDKETWKEINNRYAELIN